ncbi:hypothetical protein GCM10014715_45550 [Streptomyces spiralis]|uniref:Uncharacterized protein n=1 Tax=Streptomyces spiralis TaxID=66376 RepID=A0A919DWB1_9ACTN|nr:hypothetical protein GCM10014715_45550 [Streptomyces spiralis]
MRELMREPIGVAQRSGMRKHFHFLDNGRHWEVLTLKNGLSV